MVIHEHGDPKDPIILALHPLGLTGDNLYRAMSHYLKGEYCIIAPDQGGHGQSGPYTSLEEELDTLKTYLLDRGYTRIRLLYGASMGVAPAFELMKDPAFHFDRIWFDGGGFAEWKPHFEGTIAAAVRMVLQVYRKDPDIIEKSFAKNYGPVFAKVMKANFLRLTDEDIIRVFTMFCQRRMVPVPADVQKRMHLEWGELDGNYKQSRESIRRYMPRAEVILRGGYGHCGYMAFHTARYVGEVEAFINI